MTIPRPMGAGIKAGVALAVALALAGCGGGQSNPAPEGPLADALATVGGGGEHGSLGVGWADPRLVARSGTPRGLIGEALGPNARTVIEAAPRLHEGFGFDPTAAERLVSVGGSYAFGLRLDGVDGRDLGRRLVAAGGKSRSEDDLRLVDVGGYASVPDPLLRSGVLGLGARDAFGRDLTVLGISEAARDELLGRGARLLDQPAYRAAADCLSDVAVARLIPDDLLLSTDLGVDLVALGVSGKREEILCVVGGTDERSRAIASALESSLAPRAREPVTGEPMSRLLAASDVTQGGYQGVEAARAVLTLAPGEPSGFLFDAVARGSLARMIGAG